MKDKGEWATVGRILGSDVAYEGFLGTSYGSEGTNDICSE